jgi:pimeloyl-ACP methyl ester carboxylesterase
VRHVSDHPETSALVLLSAHRGGRSLVPMGSKAGLLAGDRLDEITAHARALVAEGRGRELLLLPGWYYVMSAASFLDMLTELPDVIELAPTVSCPTLFLRGSLEPQGLYPAEEFQQRAGGPCAVEIVDDAGHFYVGHEEAVAARVSSWLARALGAGE